MPVFHLFRSESASSRNCCPVETVYARGEHLHAFQRSRRIPQDPPPAHARASILSWSICFSSGLWRAQFELVDLAQPCWSCHLRVAAPPPRRLTPRCGAHQPKCCFHTRSCKRQYRPCGERACRRKFPAEDRATETTRTLSPYFSPKSAMAPVCSASSMRQHIGAHVVVGENLRHSPAARCPSTHRDRPERSG